MAARLRVRWAWSKKLLRQRRQIGAQQHRASRKPKMVAAHQARLQELPDHKPNLTLAELRANTGLN